MNLPEVTDVQRLALKPGDCLVVRCPERLTADGAALIRERLHAWLELPADVLVVVLDGGLSLEIAELSDGLEITR